MTCCPDQLGSKNFEVPVLSRPLEKKFSMLLAKEPLIFYPLLKMTSTTVWYVPGISKSIFSVLSAQGRNENSRFHSTATERWLKVNDKTVLCGRREKGDSIPIARMGRIRSILSITASEKMDLLQFYVSTAFLYGELEETIFMR